MDKTCLSCGELISEDQNICDACKAKRDELYTRTDSDPQKRSYKDFVSGSTLFLGLFGLLCIGDTFWGFALFLASAALMTPIGKQKFLIPLTKSKQMKWYQSGLVTLLLFFFRVIQKINFKSLRVSFVAV